MNYYVSHSLDGYGTDQMNLTWLKSPINIDKTVTLQGHQLDDYKVDKCDENFTSSKLFSLHILPTYCSVLFIVYFETILL